MGCGVGLSCGSPQQRDGLKGSWGCLCAVIAHECAMAVNCTRVMQRGMWTVRMEVSAQSVGFQQKHQPAEI